MDEAASVAPTQGANGHVAQPAVVMQNLQQLDDKDWDAYCQQHDMETKVQYFIKMTGLVDAQDDELDAFLKRFRPLMFRKRIIKTVCCFAFVFVQQMTCEPTFFPRSPGRSTFFARTSRHGC